MYRLGAVPDGASRMIRRIIDWVINRMFNNVKDWDQ